jgi:hypothetical protein
LQFVRLRAVTSGRPLVVGRFQPSDQWSATNNRPSLLRGCSKRPPCKIFLLPPTHLFLHMWSTLAGWLQHMPSLPRLFLKFSNIHNFLSVSPKSMRFVLPQSLFRGAGSQIFSKSLKIKWDKVMLPKTGLSPVWTVSPLGVNNRFLSVDLMVDETYFPDA